MMIIGVQNEIWGATRFVKYLFLADKNSIFGKDTLSIHWKSHIFGPYWDGFDAAIQELETKGLLETEEQHTMSGHATTKFSITTRGRARFNELDGEYQSEIKHLTDLIRNHQKKSLLNLLKFVYEQHPEYTRNSKIKDLILEY